MRLHSVLVFCFSFFRFFLIGSSDAFNKNPPPSIGSSIAEQFSYFTELVSTFDCDLEMVLKHIRKQKRTCYAEFAGPAITGGFGAQLCLHWIPTAMISLGFGSKLTLNVAEQPWNYGCPEHETASDVLLNVSPKSDDDDLFHKYNNKAIPSLVTSRNFPTPLICHGQEITTMMVRAAIANEYFKFEPFFEQQIRNEMLKMKLLSHQNMLAVHVRGGDKMVAEWRMSAKSLSDPNMWALKIKAVIANEKSQYHSNVLDSVVFVESDDCKLLLNLKMVLHQENIQMLHLPCELKKPIEYIQKGHHENVTGHSQNNWNEEHSCVDTIKYFTGLTIFQEASVVLLGPGGDLDGYPLPGTGTSSNTALLIEFLRHTYSNQQPSKRTYNIQGQGYPRGTLKYPNGTFSAL